MRVAAAPGAQGKEWPGDFEIVAHEKPRQGKAAKSVPLSDGGKPWLRLDIRGERKLDARCDLTFKYHVAEPTDVTIELFSRAARKVIEARTVRLAGGDSPGE